MTSFVLEGPGGIPGLKLSPSATTAKLFIFTGGANFSGGTVNFTGATVTGLSSGVESIIATSASAFSVGQTALNPQLNIDTSAASAATGLNIAGTAVSSATGVNITVLSPAATENMTLNAKGAGTIFMATAATNSGVQIGGGSSATTVNLFVRSSANNALLVASNVANPQLLVDNSVASVITGLSIQGQAVAGGLKLTVLSSGANEGATIDGKGTGTIGINTASTTSGLVTLGNSTSLAGVAVNGPLTSGAQTITSASATSMVVGRQGAVTPVLQVDSSEASQVGGLYIQGHASGNHGVTLATISSESSTDMWVNPKGAGQLILNRAGAGGVQVQSGGSSTAFLVVNATASPTNPAFNVDNSTGSAATGLNLKTAAAAGGVALTTTSSGAAENLTIAAKGTTGTITFNPAITATAGGAAADGVMFGSLSVGIFTGTGAPTFSAMNGSIYVDSNATTTTTRIYVNKSGAGTAGTTWTNLTTAA